jgi:hypothetical protein
LYHVGDFGLVRIVSQQPVIDNPVSDDSISDGSVSDDSGEFDSIIIALTYQ